MFNFFTSILDRFFFRILNLFRSILSHLDRHLYATFIFEHTPCSWSLSMYGWNSEWVTESILYHEISLFTQICTHSLVSYTHFREYKGIVKRFRFVCKTQIRHPYQTYTKIKTTKNKRKQQTLEKITKFIRMLILIDCISCEFIIICTVGAVRCLN